MRTKETLSDSVSLPEAGVAMCLAGSNLPRKCCTAAAFCNGREPRALRFIEVISRHCDALCRGQKRL